MGNDEDPRPFLRHLISHCGVTDRVIIGVDLAASGEDSSKPIDVIESARTMMPLV